MNGRVQVAINDLAGNFVDGNVNEAAATLFHELGHAYDLLSHFLGGSMIVKDGDDIELSMSWFGNRKTLSSGVSGRRFP